MKLADKLEPGERAILNKASGTIVAQVEALRELVDAFGDYAQEPQLSLEAIRLDRLIREVVTLYQQGDPGLIFNLDLCPGPEGLAADSGRLRQMLINLIRNAQEAGAGDSVSVHIRSERFDKSGAPWLKLELWDNGPGFPDKVLEQPFEPYISSKGRGSGLGLAICRKIITEHNGNISIANRPEGGAKITIDFPLALG